VSNPKVQVSPKSTPPKQAEPSQQAPSGTFSDEEIRVRAYQIYESSDRTNKHADEDWSQAQTELMELLGGK
jgi:Protein of unknown function (DUF2934)